LKYALTYREVIAILMQRHVLVDGKVRTDKTYPAGFMGMHIKLFLIFYFIENWIFGCICICVMRCTFMKWSHVEVGMQLRELKGKLAN
jgi:hypothetical protein